MPPIYLVHLSPTMLVQVFSEEAPYSRFMLQHAFEGTAVSLRTEGDLERLTGPKLVELHNYLVGLGAGGDPVRKFETLAKGRERVFKLLAAQPATDPEPTPGPHVVVQTSEGNAIPAGSPEAKAAATTTTPQPQPEGADPMAAKAAKKAIRNGAARAIKDIDETKKIRVLAKENPKREGTGAHERFAKYKSGMLVKTAIANGVTASDIRYNVEHGFIELYAD